MANPWTVYDREFVRLTYGHVPPPRIARHLGRTTGAVYRHIDQLRNDRNNSDRTSHGRRPAVVDVLPAPSRHAPPWIPGRGTTHREQALSQSKQGKTLYDLNTRS